MYSIDNTKPCYKELISRVAEQERYIYGQYPRELSQLTPDYFKVLPTCASAGTMSYRYIHSTEPEAYTVWCAGKYHKDTCGIDFPQYDSSSGLIEGQRH